jgi:Flp pilus assembly protein TadB
MGNPILVSLLVLLIGAFCVWGYALHRRRSKRVKRQASEIYSTIARREAREMNAKRWVAIESGLRVRDL